MKKFTIPCDFNGQKHPFAVYVGLPRDDRHPLQNQAHWLSSEKGGNIPPEVMESFQKLHAIAKENDVVFEDLCMYALGQASEEKQLEQSEG
jgi:hypothetical protein